MKCADCGTKDFTRIRKYNSGKPVYEKSRYVKDLQTGDIICGLCLDLRTQKDSSL